MKTYILKIFRDKCYILKGFNFFLYYRKQWVGIYKHNRNSVSLVAARSLFLMKRKLINLIGCTSLQRLRIFQRDHKKWW